MESNVIVRNGELVIAVLAILIAVAGGVAQLGEPVEQRAQTAQR